MRREHALVREKISISHDKGAHLFVGYHIFPIFVRPSVEEWRVDDSASRSLGGSAEPGAESFAMKTHIRSTKERFIDHAKPRCHRADGVLLSQLPEVSRAFQLGSAVRRLTTSAESEILPGRQDDVTLGAHQEAADDARIWIQFELRQSLPGPFSSLDPDAIVNQGHQAFRRTVPRFCSFR